MQNPSGNADCIAHCQQELQPLDHMKFPKPLVSWQSGLMGNEWSVSCAWIDSNPSAVLNRTFNASSTLTRAVSSDGSAMRDVFGAQGAGRIYHAFMETALAGVPARAGGIPRPRLPHDWGALTHDCAHLPMVARSQITIKPTKSRRNHG